MSNLESKFTKQIISAIKQGISNRKQFESKKIREFDSDSDSTKEYDQAIRFLIKDLVKNHGISRGASLERILSMFQSFYNKAIEYGDSAGSKKVNRIVGKYL
jgi:hypothetical protein